MASLLLDTLAHSMRGSWVMESLARRRHVFVVVGFIATLGLTGFGFGLAHGEEAAADGPALDVQMTPSVVKTTLDKNVTFEIVVTNNGKSAATGLLVVDQFDKGLEHAISTSPIEHDLADLSPGKSQRLTLTFKVNRSGLLSHTIEIRSHGKTAATAKASIRGVDAEAAASDGLPSDSQGAQNKEERTKEDTPQAKPEETSAFGDIPFRKSEPEDEQDKVPDLGEPLVDHPENLKRFQPENPLWVDRNGRRVVLIGGVCLRQGYLELFACIWRSKEHESIVTVPIKAVFVHGALMAVGAEPGKPVQYEPKYVPPSGTEIEITLFWKDKAGKRQTARAQEWVRNVKTKKPMEQPWVFTGSQLLTNKQSGKVAYQADRDGDLICVSNFPSAVLDLPIASSSDNAELMFEANTEKIPPVGTPVTMVLTPKINKPASTPKSLPPSGR